MEWRGKLSKFKKQRGLKYYNSKLSSDFNLDKNLKKDKRDNQLVKCKNIGLYLLLHISIDYEE